MQAITLTTALSIEDDYRVMSSEYDANRCIGEAKKKYAARIGVDHHLVVLHYGDRIVSDDDTIASLEIKSGDTLLATLAK